MSKANRPRARQRTSDVKKYLTAWTNRRPVTRSKATGCSLIHVSPVTGHSHPPVNPARRVPATDLGAAAHHAPNQAGEVVLRGRTTGPWRMPKWYGVIHQPVGLSATARVW